MKNPLLGEGKKEEEKNNTTTPGPEFVRSMMRQKGGSPQFSFYIEKVVVTNEPESSRMVVRITPFKAPGYDVYMTSLHDCFDVKWNRTGLNVLLPDVSVKLDTMKSYELEIVTSGFNRVLNMVKLATASSVPPKLSKFMEREVLRYYVQDPKNWVISHNGKYAVCYLQHYRFRQGESWTKLEAFISESVAAVDPAMKKMWFQGRSVEDGILHSVMFSASCSDHMGFFESDYPGFD
jgi:hypothetical protein